MATSWHKTARQTLLCKCNWKLVSSPCSLYEQSSAQAAFVLSALHTRYWLTDGSVSIDKGAKHIATVHPPGFIGEMAFLNCFLVDEDEDGGDSSIAGNIATANAVVGKGGAVAWTWTFEQLLTYLEHEREISNALSAYMNYDLRAKLVKKGVSMADLDSEETSPATKTTP